MSGLPLPRIITDTGDAPSESSDDHFSSASEGTPNPNRLSTDGSQSPIPITRVERVDDKAAYGEEPGTPAYALRTADAVPDEVEVVPEGRRARSGTQSRSRSHSNLSVSSRPPTPGGSPVPHIKVERLDDKPAYGEVEGTVAKEMREFDAQPDEMTVVERDDDGRSEEVGDAKVGEQQAWLKEMWEGKQQAGQPTPPPPQQQEQEEPQTLHEDENDQGEEAEAAKDDDDDDDDDFGDDFDEFAEEGGDDDDFGDFDEADGDADEGGGMEETLPSSSLAGLSPLNLTLDLSPDDLDSYLDAIFPTHPSNPTDIPTLNMSNSSPFLSDRSLSLWQQLVSPPPMQPPNWTRSRIRRLFLVSLGVPVDLDEILPPSKQKRLVLPNINLPASPRASTLERLKRGDGGNESSTSIDSKTGTAKKSSTTTSRRRGPPPPPEFDANSAVLICRTTVEAMEGLEDGELKSHLESLEGLNRRSSGVLEYWLQRKDEALKEKEALEGVIENLVGFVKGRRGGK
ncbi:uncharacterized protein RCC_03289 [Ramularia collo-cygni]|uniref:Uncharacterized protein n=1 Tax=Ramularia collo-cygni TaxID=112498 RepID=A0A2D3UTZ1_9PEZI|nr:uncharacterized protein RCC_03289 [Ramularia collo-cygni]CZT17455.1 uncharacterized protein RCC_03289 [Ramularia collo-cygni]